MSTSVVSVRAATAINYSFLLLPLIQQQPSGRLMKLIKVCYSMCKGTTGQRQSVSSVSPQSVYVTLVRETSAEDDMVKLKENCFDLNRAKSIVVARGDTIVQANLQMCYLVRLIFSE